MGAGRASAAVSADFYGVNVQQVFNGPPSAWQPQLSAIGSGGLQLARLDARWSNVEPNPPSRGIHSYDWSDYDPIVAALAAHGIRWYPIVGYSTGWAGVIPGDSNSVVAPAHVLDFAAYAAALARRYGRGGSFWRAHPSLPQLPVEAYEIWNEENSTAFMRPQTSAPEAYADLYLAARAAIRSADPHATVVVGGLALGNPGVTDEIQFIQRMYAHRPDLAGNVDAVGLHPYQSTLAYTYMRLARFRQGLDQLAGASVPIEITEIGWSTTAVSESDRAAYLAGLAEQLPRSDCNVSRLIPHTWLTQETNPSDPEDWFGIWNHDGTGKPSGLAYLGAVRLMRGMSPAAPPAGPVQICHSAGAAGAAAGRAHGPRLRLRVLGVRHRRHRYLRLAVRCRPACLMRLQLFGLARGATRRKVAPMTTRSLGLRSGRQRVIRLKLRRVRRFQRRAELVAIAAGAGGVTVRARAVRIR